MAFAGSLVGRVVCFIASKMPDPATGIYHLSVLFSLMNGAWMGLTWVDLKNLFPNESKELMVTTLSIMGANLSGFFWVLRKHIDLHRLGVCLLAAALALLFFALAS